ncbi:MAG: FtsX-like permease family protein [Gammaproteobacteria bacterium]|nr:MAG: FtsX-like permease family protein [Gammaproteobacteria bacterium]
MVILLKHIARASHIALLGIKQRLFRSLTSVIGTAGVVGVLVSILSIAAGYEKALSFKGADDSIIIFRSGAKSELESSFTGDQLDLIRNNELIATDKQGKKIFSAESYVIVNIDDKSTAETMNVALRGVQPAGFDIRHQLKLVEGRLFEPGKAEIIVGKKSQSQFSGLQIGDKKRFSDSEWTVVGIFEANGTVLESELWTDNLMLQSAYMRANSAQVVYVKLAEGVKPIDFQNSLNKDPRLNVQVTTEADYYAEQSAMLNKFVKRLGFGIAILMAFGAVFAAVNTNFSTVIARRRELATLETLGIKKLAIVVSVVVESTALTLLGAILGCLLVYFLFDGYTTSTLFFSKNFSQVVFSFHVSAYALGLASIFATVIGVAGALLPAIKLGRTPLVKSLAAV